LPALDFSQKTFAGIKLSEKPASEANAGDTE